MSFRDTAIKRRPFYFFLPSNETAVIKIAVWLRSSVATFGRKTRLTRTEKGSERDLSKLCSRCRWDYTKAAPAQTRIKFGLKGKVTFPEPLAVRCLCCPAANKKVFTTSLFSPLWTLSKAPHNVIILWRMRKVTFRGVFQCRNAPFSLWCRITALNQ